MEAKERVEEVEEEVWSWGAGTDGQLGTGRLQDEHLPLLLPSLSTFAPISLLSCGGAHVLALTHEMGCLFTCGDGSFGQLGHGDYRSQCSPVKVSYFASRHLEQIACGMRHSLALLKDHSGDSGDQVYGFGSGKRGQLGISKDKIKSTSLPQIILGLEDVKISSISASGDHSTALSADGHIYTWGRGFSGSSDTYYPHCAIPSLSFTQVALGWNHALVLTGDGKVFMLGGNHHGLLSNAQETNSVKCMFGNAEESNEALIQTIPGLNGIKVVQVAAGAEHSALVTEDGVLKTWGWGEHGQLGMGNTGDETSPQLVSLGHKLAKEHITTKVYCGSGFTFAVRTPSPT